MTKHRLTFAVQGFDSTEFNLVFTFSHFPHLVEIEAAVKAAEATYGKALTALVQEVLQRVGPPSDNGVPVGWRINAAEGTETPQERFWGTMVLDQQFDFATMERLLLGKVITEVGPGTTPNHLRIVGRDSHGAQTLEISAFADRPAHLTIQ